MKPIAFKDLKRVMDAEPLLTDFGIGIYPDRNLTPAERREQMDRGREFLSTCLDEVEICRRWLLLNRRLKSAAGAFYSSYWLKHCAERYAERNDWGRSYVCNGAMIAAVMYLEIPYERIAASPNVMVGVGRATVRRLAREAGLCG